MDWMQTFVILGSFMGCFIYLSSKIDKLTDRLSVEIQNTREEILWIKFRLDPNEHPQWKKESKETKEE